MRFFKYTNDGFVSLSTLDADGDGNITQTEYNEILTLIHEAEDGYGVVETQDGYGYAPLPVEPEPELTDEEALEILLGGAT